MNQLPSCDKDFALQKLSDFFEEIFKTYAKKEKEERERKREK